MNFCKSIAQRVFCFSAFVLFPPSAWAEDEPKIYEFSFSLLGLPPMEQTEEFNAQTGLDLNLYELFFLLDDKAEPLGTIPLYTKSRVHDYRGYGPLTFFRQATDDDGNVTRQVLARVQPESDWNNVLFLVKPLKTGAPEGFSTFAIPTDERDLPPGSVKIINLTGANLAWMLDETINEVPAHRSDVISLDVAQPRMIPLRIAVLEKNNGGWQRLYSSSIGFRANRRYLSIVLPSADDANRPQMPPLLIPYTFSSR